MRRGWKVGQVQRRGDGDDSALVSLINEIGQAARNGWPHTVRLMALLIVAAGAVALVLAVWR
jgi:hypothetical protein